ncbi:cysteine hydrolase family protein [Actinoplanes sp. CA-252034]|uniref:cysteine hydrolase family protein n=1 Tax=Actinoplanes sp. CA-252034 TaxID=3239906 RepID=UPI003D9682BD
MTADSRKRGRDVALILLDVQNELVDPAGAVGSHGLAGRVTEHKLLLAVGRLLTAAREAAVPVVHVGNGFREGHPEVDEANPLTAAAKAGNEFVLGSWGARFHPETAPQPGEYTVVKSGMSAFAHTALDPLLTVLHVRTMLLCGLVTNLAVEGTARDAADRGYRPVVVSDACVGLDDTLHDFSCQVMRRFAQVVSLEKALGRLPDH